MQLLLALLALMLHGTITATAPNLPCSTAVMTATGTGLRTVTCDRVLLDAVPDTVPSDVESLLLPNNRIAVLRYAAIARFADNLQELDLTNNYIESIPSDIFANMTKLRKVNLSRNRFRRMPMDFITAAPYLEELILTRNKLPELPMGFLRNVPRLRRLVLAECEIEIIHPNAFDVMATTALSELDLSSNMLEQLHVAVATTIFTPTLTTLRLYNNFWLCDCRLRWLRRLLRTWNVRWTFDGDTYVPACEEPKQLKHKSWQLVTEDKFGCPPSTASSEHRKQVTFITGTQMTISCIFESDPACEVSWDHDGASLDTSRRFTRTTHQNGTQMTALLTAPIGATSRDEGAYTCTASSPFGSANATIVVSVVNELDATINHNTSMTATIIISVLVATVVIILAAVAAYCIRRRLAKRGTYLKEEGASPLPLDRAAYSLIQSASNTSGLQGNEDDEVVQFLSEANKVATVPPPDVIKLYPEDSEPFLNVEAATNLATLADPVSEYPRDDAGYREYNDYLAMIAEPTEDGVAMATTTATVLPAAVFVPGIPPSSPGGRRLQTSSPGGISNTVSAAQVNPPQLMPQQQFAVRGLPLVAQSSPLNTIPEENGL